MILRLTNGQLGDITAQAQAAYPAEACGLLMGSGNDTLTVTTILPATNLMAEHPGRFELDPRVRLAAEKQCRGTPNRIIGHWHSHPNGPAEPSATDLAMAFEPELIWLIIAVPAKGPTETKAFHLNSTTSAFVQIPLNLIKRACIPPIFPT